MNLSSPKIVFDKKLLAIEEQFRQRKYQGAASELEQFSPAELESKPHELGLWLLLKADASYYEGNYQSALKFGLNAVKKLANSALNRRYGRAQLLLSKAYSAIGEMKNAEIRARDALASFRRASDSAGQIDSLNELARISFVRCDYPSAGSFVDDAIALVTDNPRKRYQLTGNLGRIRTFTGQWSEAEKALKEALKYSVENGEEISQAVNLLSLGYLELRRRRFAEATRSFNDAKEIIDKLRLTREQIIYLEYTGELALERGDIYKAKAILSDAYQKGLLLAPGSALVTQAGRRLAQAELILDNVEEAMKYGQKALDLSLEIGEKTEIGASRRVIAEVFAARGDFDDALDYGHQAVDLLREVGDPQELALSLLSLARSYMGSDGCEAEYERIRTLFDEAHSIFRKLRVEFWVAETEYRSGMLACQQGALSTGFRKLSHAERIFAREGIKTKVRAVTKFLRTLAEQAAALSISSENKFKVFGNLVTPSECSDLKSSCMEDVLDILLKRTHGARALVYAPDSEGPELLSSFPMPSQQMPKFREYFGQLLGEEISATRPTLVLDSRRDPFVNKLLGHIPAMVASIVVVPFKMGDGSTCYLYVDKISNDSSLNPFNQAELNFAVGFSDLIAFKWTELQKNSILEENRRMKSQLMEHGDFPNIITQSSIMSELLGQVRQVVDSNISVSIEGETGTGKDLLARAIHFGSKRRDKRFISVNCAALPETLLESELFGYKRGAFTGADQDKPGLFEAADGGTFFLDEIADMPLSVQAKVLRVLEEKEIVRLGETTPRKVDVRVVSATNKDLKEQMAAGLFRQDLYYRLSALVFRLPALRERREDIPLLVTHFADDQAGRISPEVMKLIVNYEWPGNVRELENEVRKLILLSADGTTIGLEAVSAKLRGAAPVGAINTPVAVPDDQVQFTDAYSLYDYLAAHEKRFIVDALRKKKGVKKHAAALLNIPESTLRLKIKQYEIDPRNLDATL